MQGEPDWLCQKSRPATVGFSQPIKRARGVRDLLDSAEKIQLVWVGAGLFMIQLKYFSLSL